MKKLFTMMIALSLLLAGCDKEMESLEVDNAALKSAGTGFVDPNTFDDDGNLCLLATQTMQDQGTPMELWMGVGNEKAGTLVGHVKFVPGKVIIDLTDSDQDGTPDMYPYVIEEIHIHFASSLSGIPQTKKGNPIPGKFEYNIPVDPYTFQTTFPIDVDFDAYGAIHLSVMKPGGIEGFAFYLPNDPVQVKFTYPGPSSYLQLEILSDNAGTLKGTYENWCVNTGITLDPSQEFDALLYSSYEPIPNVNEIVNNPDNFDLINYLINHYTEGTVVDLKNIDCTPILNEGIPVSEAITWQDIQMAIWYLIDGGSFEFTGLTPTWTQERVNAIVCEVEENGEGFEPDCDQNIVFVVVPINKEDWPDVRLIVGQPSVSSVPVLCADEGGTAWGDGYYGATFGGNQWGTWFKYDATCGQ